MSYNAQRNYQKPPTYGPTANLLTESSPNLSIPAAFRGPQSLRSQASTSTLNQDNRYGSTSTLTVTASISDKFSLAPDPTAWGSNLSPHYPEPDDYLHNPDPKRDRRHDAGGTVFTYRGATNLGCIIVLSLGLVTLFGGYPVISYFNDPFLGTQGGFNIGGINATGQIPTIAGNFGLIDVDTPKEAFTKTSMDTGEELQLVFSDEFNVEGRSFYPGDDPYWEAVDLHYWGTNNMEWYDPAAITTADGALQITLSEKETHDLHYQGGMMSTWNKFCFTGGYIEAATILPGSNNVVGLWPAIWTMGNLGRAGYGASLDGTWPYSYDSCDIGTVRNQSLNGKPEMTTYDGDAMYDGVLSFLPGQRLSRCTCPDESHPGPIHPDGTYVGRSAPEIDIFEAQISGDPLRGKVSQSGQWAPFNYAYEWFNTSDNMVIYDEKTTQQNTYKGGAFQQSTSGVSWTNQDCYQLGKQCYSVYGFEYQPGYDDGYITWVNDDKPAWTFRGSGTAADTRVEIGPRPVPQEPMYILANLGMSTNFGSVDLEHLHFPSVMSVDYIRVYQPKGAINIGCDPDDFPTQSYIKQYIEAYTNPNLTTWVDDYGQAIPRNSFLGEC